MQKLIWCFTSVSGRLPRQPFGLAMASLILLSVATTRILVRVVPSGPIYYGPEGPPAANTPDLKVLFVALLFLWPTAAVQIKRLNDLGLDYRAFVGIAIVLGILTIVDPAAAFLANIPLLCWLVLTPSKDGASTAR
jgi:uncharacterized membrane protein YhaH (DUF805 family)